MKRVLLTGVGGFIGAHCLEYFLDNTDWFIIGLDSWRHKGSHRRIEDVVGSEKLEKYSDRYKILKHDLSVPISYQLKNLIQDAKIDDMGNVVRKPIDCIINMASESAVERSTTDPVSCIRNNVELEINMLEFARKVKPKIFFQVSTDEVYGEAQPNQAHHEWDVIMPSNPYAASKAAQEALAISYWRCFDVPVVLTNTMNNFGEGQDPEKFIPKLINFVKIGKTMPIYGDSEDDIGARYYLHAKNHADAFVFLSKFDPTMYNSGENQRPDRYNVCGDVELNNLEMGNLIAKFVGKELKYELIPSESARKGYDRRYALDGSKMKEKGWMPPVSFEDSIEQVVEWTLKNQHWAV
jgi:dTDP-glucose 4,6-dehydratase